MLTLLVLAALASPTTFAPTVDLLSIRAEPDSSARERGRLAIGEPFYVTEQRAGPGCDGPWGRLLADAWTCLDKTEPTDRAPAVLPRPIAFEPPFPDDFADYSETGTWTRRGTQEDDLLPFVYARRWKDWKGRIYDSVDAYLAGEQPSGRLPAGRRANFVDAVTTDSGVLLVRDDGTAVPEEDVYIFPITRFEGRDLLDKPIPAGKRLAWVTGYEGVNAYLEPSTAREPKVVLQYHQSFLVDAEPPAPRWLRSANAFGAGMDAFVRDTRALRQFEVTERPADVGPDEVWIDIDVTDAVLGVYRGDTPIYATLVSPGLDGRTPRGEWRVEDKRVWHTMRSRAGSDDPYYVEAVPWTVFFKPMYALHGAYWHWGFGNNASHGCVNLSPRDARWVYEHIEPAVPTGWHTIIADEQNPGTLIRLR